MQYKSRKALPINIFYSYASADEELREELQKRLSPLQSQGRIAQLHQQEIPPGTDRTQTLSDYLLSASIILFLVSPDFMASNYYTGPEVQYALKRHNAGEAHIIPILLRPATLEGTFLENLQCLPRNKVPITRWSNPDDAFLDVESGIREVLRLVESINNEQLHQSQFLVNKEADRIPRKILLGLAIDLSESMKQNINNDMKEGMSRLDSFQHALNKFLSAAKKEIASHKAIKEIDIFIYGFGLRIPDLEVCDILTLQEYVKRSTPLSGELKEKLETDIGQNFVDLLTGLFAPYVANDILVRAKKEIIDLGNTGPGCTTVSLSDLSRRLPEKESYWDSIAEYLYGETPMLEALQTIFARFERESANYTDTTLCIVSDGLPTDGTSESISNFIHKFWEKDITIASCFVTSKNQTDSQHLYSVSQPSWDEGANLLFKMASLIPPSYVSSLSAQGWKKGPKNPWGPEEGLDRSVKLFIQANHSSILDKFLSDSILPLLSEVKDKLS